MPAFKPDDDKKFTPPTQSLRLGQRASLMLEIAKTVVNIFTKILHADRRTLYYETFKMGFNFEGLSLAHWVD